jgi:hypothetical protein
VQCDSEQAALGREVDGEIEDGARDHAVHDAPHAPGVLLEHEKVVRPDERHRARRHEPADGRPHTEVRVEDGWASLGLDGSSGGSDRQREPDHDGGRAECASSLLHDTSQFAVDKDGREAAVPAPGRNCAEAQGRRMTALPAA